LYIHHIIISVVKQNISTQNRRVQCTETGCLKVVYTRTCTVEVCRHRLCRYQYDIDISDPKCRRYRHPSLQRFVYRRITSPNKMLNFTHIIVFVSKLTFKSRESMIKYLKITDISLITDTISIYRKTDI